VTLQRQFTDDERRGGRAGGDLDGRGPGSALPQRARPRTRGTHRRKRPAPPEAGGGRPPQAKLLQESKVRERLSTTTVEWLLGRVVVDGARAMSPDTFHSLVLRPGDEKGGRHGGAGR
jgi:hypothetical protein